MKRRRVVAFGLVCIVLAAARRESLAQGVTPQPIRPPTFHTGVDAVLLDIVVRDKKGRPVRDLHRDEVVVVEDGQPREVSSFRLVEGEAPPAQVEPASGASTMRPDPLRRITLVTLVFDRLGQNARQLARQAALDFVSKDFPPGQWISVFTLDDRLTLRQDFTRDRAALTRAIDRAMLSASREEAAPLPAQTRERDTSSPYANVGADQGPGGGAGGGSSVAGTAAVQAAMDAVVQRVKSYAESAELQQRGQSTLFPLMALAKAEGALEGRKAILLFSEGFRVPANLEEAFRSTISEANRANVSFYAVDARGLDTSRALEAAGAALDKAGRTSQQELAKRGAGAVTVDEVMNTETAQAALQSNTQAVLEELAESTGGFLIGNSNDLRKGLDKVSGDLASYYEIAYAPKDSPFDGRFRKVEVKVSRKGVDVQARTGYFALPPTDTAPLMPYELPLLAAAAALPPPHAFDYRVGAFRFHRTPRGRQYSLFVEVPLDSLTFDENRKAKTYTLRFTVLALVKDSSGRIVERMSNAYPLEGPIDKLPALKRGNIVFKRQLWLSPGRYTLWSVARDQASDRASVQRVDLDVPVEREGVRVSSLSIIRRVDQAGEQADSVEDPFRSGPMRIVPSLDAPISKSANKQISAYVVVYPDSRRTDKPALTFDLVQNGKVFGRAGAELPAADEHGRVSYVATFPADLFAPGAFELRAVARQGDSEDSATTTFTVVP